MAEVSDDVLKAILAGCEGVTPGPWDSLEDGRARVTLIHVETSADHSQVAGAPVCSIPKKRRKDAEHIARLDPQTVASIVSELIELRALSAASSAAEPVASERVTVGYTNWRGEFAERTIVPISIWYGSTEWHPEPQWLVKAVDVARDVERDFALASFGHSPSWEQGREELVGAATALTEFAWTDVTADCDESRVYLNRLIANLRAAIRALPATPPADAEKGAGE